MTSTTITVTGPGLSYAQITVRADSTVAMAEHTVGSQQWYALLVDGRYFDLVLTKHTVGRPELVEGCNAVLSEVEQAVAALQPAPPVRHTVAYGPGYNETLAELIGTFDWDPFNRRSQTIRQIGQCEHTGGGTMRAFRAYENANTGTVIKVIVYGIDYDAVMVFENREAYRASERKLQAMEPDPETGRR